MLVSAPLAHQRKLVEDADKSTTHHAKTDSRLDSLPLPAPAEQTQRAKSGRAPGSGPACAGGNANTIRPAPMDNKRTAPKDRNKSFMSGTAFNLVALQSRMDKSRKLEMA